MNVTREQIYGALFARLQALGPTSQGGNGTAVTVSRRLRHWRDLRPEQQPAIYMVQRHERPSEARGRVAYWELHVDLYVYAHAGADPTAVPATLLNAIFDQLEAALAPDPVSGAQTLGGLVSHCWIDPAGIETDEGALGEQAVAIVPVGIRATI
ncbi:MAG TPA: hypothetical protein VKY65_17955 [Alphaproteobacteria bacterium]|nr:hypothetical protein [Alphaproteobacteria bacterium]